jgi:hypothetical protein
MGGGQVKTLGRGQQARGCDVKELSRGAEGGAWGLGEGCKKESIRLGIVREGCEGCRGREDEKAVTAIKEPREKAWGKDQRRTPSGRKATFRPEGQQDEDGEPVKADPALGEFKAEDAKRAKALLLE